MTESELIKGCLARDQRVQKKLYDLYAPVLMGLCRRYITQKEDAEEILVESFYKIFSNIRQFKGKGSFEGWMKRIAVNESLMFLRKKHNFNVGLESSQVDLKTTPIAEKKLFENDILKLLDHLPTGYRTIFNLYVIEGYTHKEIAEKLDISINTSKSQLIHAKRRLRELIKKNERAVA
jgi:RNA polymerase sigma factor (sigma-70 family)